MNVKMKFWVKAYASQHRTREAYRWSADTAVYIRKGHTRHRIGTELYHVAGQGQQYFTTLLSNFFRSE